MELSASELATIKRALIIYDLNLYKGLKGKDFFIDRDTLDMDIINIHNLLQYID